MTTPRCFNCVHFAGRGEGTWHCIQGNSSHAVATPERGCAFWTHNPRADEGIQTESDWIRAYGLPVGRYSDNEKPWPPPMAPSEIRAAWNKHKIAEVRVLAWEIARLRDVIDRAAAALLDVAHMSMPDYPRACLERLAEILKRKGLD